MRLPVHSTPAMTDEACWRELRSGLHALAQPLTLLQIRLEAAMLCGGDAAEPHLLSSLNEDVRRACAQFSSLQDLASRNTVAPPSHRRCIGQDLLQAALKSLSPHTDGSTAKLRLSMPQHPLWILANEQDVRRSLLQAVLIMRGMLAASDVLHLSLHAGENCVRIQATALERDDSGAETSPALVEIVSAALTNLGFTVNCCPHLEATLHLPRDLASGAESFQ